MKIAVIVPTLNEAESIGGFVKSLMLDPYSEKEVIVVDGGSTDGTIDMAKKVKATVINEKGERKSPANAWNQGARSTDAEIICFLDGDYVRVGNLFITTAMKHFENPNVIGVTYKYESLVTILESWVGKAIESARRSAISKLWGKKWSDTSGYTVIKNRVIFLSKKVFERLGGYPPLGYGEDGVFAQKLNEYLRTNPDEKIITDENLVVVGRRKPTLRRFFKGHVWYGRTMIPYLKITKVSALYKLVILTLPLVYLFSMISIPLMLVSFWFLIPALPYVVKLTLIFFESAKHHDKYRLLTPVLDFVAGIGHMVGLMQYSTGKKSLSRGLDYSGGN